MNTAASIILTLAVFFVAAVTRPHSARCPSGYWLSTGVRPSGVYTCAPLPRARWVRGPRGGWVDESRDEEGGIEGEVWCTGGSHAVTNDGVAVGCQR